MTDRGDIMRLIDGSELLEHACRERLDSRELVTGMIENAQTVVSECNDCSLRGDVKKCLLASVAAKNSIPLTFLDRDGKWFCADWKPKERK